MHTRSLHETLFFCIKITNQEWIPPASPAFLPERQPISPMAQSLPTSRGSLGRQRPAHPPRQRYGGSNIRKGSWKAKGGANAEANTSERRVGGRADADAGVDTNNSSGDSSGYPRPQEQAPRDDEIRGARANSVQGAGLDSGADSALARGGCGEAWGAPVVVAAQNSERLHSGPGSTRESKNPTISEVWAWTGTGGGAARGKAMLNAYGLQVGKHSPTCPRGTRGGGAAKHGRWQRGQVGGAGKVEGGSLAVKADREKNGGVEGSGTGECRRGGGGEHGGEQMSDRVSSGHGPRFRGGKSRKQRATAASTKLNTTSRRSKGRASSVRRDRGVWHENGSSGNSAGHTRTAASESGNEKELVATTTATSSKEPTMDGCHPADQIRWALEDPLVPPHNSTSNELESTQGSHEGGCAAPAATAVIPTATTTSVLSGQVATLTMDGRGGSAAPPHRPQQLNLKAPSSALYTPVLPDLAGTGGVGSGVMAAFEADSGCRHASGEASIVGDDYCTRPVSRQRSLSTHSPWHARKHPRGFPGGRGGAGFGRCHHHPDRSLVGGRTKSERPDACFSSEPTANVTTFTHSFADSVTATGAGARGADRLWVAPPISFAKPADEAPDDQENVLTRASLGCCSAIERATINAEGESSLTVTATPSATRDNGEVDAAARDGLDPFNRLHHGSAAATPQSELIDHFKLASRPTSRRGTRKQGTEGDNAQPEPAFCLFSGHRDDRGRRSSHGRGSRERGKEERRSKSRDCGRN